MTLLIVIPSIVSAAFSSLPACIGYNITSGVLECYNSGHLYCSNPSGPTGQLAEGWKKLGPWFGINIHNAGYCGSLKTSAVHEFCKTDSGKCFPVSSIVHTNSPCLKDSSYKNYSSYYECTQASCGTSACNSGEKCIDTKCWKKISTEDNDANCKQKAQSLPSFKYDGATKACYLSGDALKKFNEQGGDIIKVYNEIKPPKNTIRIPGLDFASISSTLDDEGYIYMPWIGQYVSTVYKFALVAASLIAVLMILIQGLTIMAGQGMATVEKWDGDSGSKQKQQVALQKIGKILLGLIIAWSSYTILYMIDPHLVEFKSLKVKYIKQVPLIEFIDKGEPGSSASSAKNPKELQDPTYNPIFKKYGSQYNIDWQVLKAIAYKESSLDAGLTNSMGFQGLFQFKKSTCPSSIGPKCNNLLDPDNNTHAGAIMLSNNIAAIKKYCPTANDEVLFTLLYMSHNSGMGAIICATKSTCKVQTEEGQPSSKWKEVSSGGACNLKSIEKGVIAFWENHWKKKFVTNRGPRTYSFSYKTAQTIINAKKTLK